MMHIYIGNLAHTLSPGTLEILASHAIGIDDKGKIEFLKRASEYERQPSDIVTELGEDQFLFPGFIDAHVHAPQFPNCGIFGDSTLLDWLETYTFPLESRYGDVDLAKLVYSKLIDRQLKSGTTTSSYFGTIHVPSTVELAKICLEKGQRALVGRVCMERLCPESLMDGSIDSDIEFIESIQKLDPTGRRVRPIVTPRFAPSCEFETLRALGDLAHTLELPVQTHISENLQELELVRELFPEASSYTDVYDRAHLLKHDTVLAHGIHFSKDELDTIRERKAGIVHCPDSNASIASGIAQVKRLLNSGIKVGLGSDVSGGSTVSILHNAKLALLMSRLLSQREGGSAEPILSIADALFLATLGGAQVLNMDAELGTFEVGKQFDAQLIDVNSIDSPIDVFNFAVPTKIEDKILNYIQKWVYLGDDRNTVQVWVAGNLVYLSPTFTAR